jgi:tRNA threonylcarbamoyl adenosine modification protein YeaZ
MKILALEFSTNRRSVAIAEMTPDGFRLCSSATDDSQRMTGMVLLDRALAEAGLAPGAVGVLAVGLGPGSYAGIRSAIAICQGWQLARDTPLLGISSIEVLAREAQLVGTFGEVNIVIDAQRREFYRARFAVSKEAISPIESVLVIPKDQAEVGGKILGPDIAKLISGGIDLYPSATELARIASTRSDFLPGEELEPIYLRETTFLKAAKPRFTQV